LPVPPFHSILVQDATVRLTLNAAHPIKGRLASAANGRFLVWFDDSGPTVDRRHRAPRIPLGASAPACAAQPL